MKSVFFGDSYDIVKRFFIDILKRNGYSVAVGPNVLQGHGKQIEEPFHRFIGAERLSDAEWPSVRSRTALLLDPDTGVGAKATRQHVTLERIVDELERYEIVFSFDQSFLQKPVRGRKDVREAQWPAQEGCVRLLLQLPREVSVSPLGSRMNSC